MGGIGSGRWPGTPTIESTGSLVLDVNQITIIDSQVASLQSAGVDTLIAAAIPKFAAQAIRKVYDIGWKPLFSPAGCRGRAGGAPPTSTRLPEWRLSNMRAS